MKLTKRDFALLGIIIYFTFIGGTFYSQFNFGLRVFNQVFVTSILSVWLLTKLRNKEGLPPTYLDLAIALYLIVSFISAIFGQSSRFSLEAVWFSVVHLLAFYLLVDLRRRGWTPKLTWAFYMASAAVCLVGLAEYIAWYVGTPLISNFAQGWIEIGGWQQPIPPKLYRLNITLNGSTPLSAYLALLIPPAIALVISLPPKNENRRALLIWLALALAVQILTFSRAGILALGTSLVLLVLGWLKVTGKRFPTLSSYWSRLRSLYRLYLLLSGAAMVAVGLIWLQRSFANRAGSTQFRFTLWQTAVTIFSEHPVVGVGPANFGRALLRLNDSLLPRKQIATAHNIYLNTAVELGLVGLIVGGFLFLMIGWAWRMRWHQATNPVERIRLIGVGAALTGLAVQMLVDTYTATPNILIILALVAYIVSDLKPATFPTRRTYTAYIGLIILLIYALGFARIAVADFHFQRSFAEEGAGNLAQAIAQVGEAQTLDPGLTIHTFRRALLEARLADQTGDQNLIRTAAEHYQQGLAQEPIWGLNSANLAGLLWHQGERAEAIDTLRRSIIAEEDPLYLINLGYLYEQEGNWAEARVAYGRSLFVSPDLAASDFWQSSSARAERWSDYVDTAVENISADDNLSRRALRAKLALVQGDFDAVEALIEPDTPQDDEPFQSALAQLHLSRNQPNQAMAILDSTPKRAGDYLLEGRVKLQLEDYAAAEKLLKTAIFLGQREAYYYLGQLYEQQGDLQAAELAYQRGFSPHATSENITVTIYGRPGANDIVPQLLRIGVGPEQAKSWLALAKLYEEQQRIKEATRIYEILLAEDPFLRVAHERLKLIAENLPP